MQCIAFLFTLIIFTLIYLAFLLIWTPTGYLFKIKNKKAWFLSSIPVFIIISIVFVLYQNRPAAIYEYRFGFSPTSDVTILEKHDWYFADTGQTYLRFIADQGTINKIIGRGLTKAGVNERCNIVDDLPWWNPDDDMDTVLYTEHFSNRLGEERIREQDFATERECLYYNPLTKEAHYYFIGID